MPKLMIRCIQIGLASCIAQVGVSASPCLAADVSDLHQKNRQLVAKDYDVRNNHVSAARISLQRPTVERGWLSRILNTGRDPDWMEVLAHLKAGESLPIDRIGADAFASATITDDTGAVVGYFRYSLLKEKAWTSHRVAFVIYLLRSNGVVRREGEVKCRKIGDEGVPRVQVSNARWDAELRELEFDVRSSCYHVDLFGGGAQRTLNLALGTFTFDTNFSKPGAWVDQGQRLIVGFDERGDSFAFDVVKADTASRRAFKKCVEDSKTDLQFRVCSNGNVRRAFWRARVDHVSYDFCPAGAEALGETYFVRACSDSRDDATRSVEFNIASQEAPKGVDALLECSCSRLWIDRLNFNPLLRSLSFNLDTDAKKIAFAGGEFQVPTISSRTLDGKLSMQVPVFTITFNERWQIVQMTAVGGDTSVVDHMAGPPREP